MVVVDVAACEITDLPFCFDGTRDRVVLTVATIGEWGSALARIFAVY